MDELVRNEIETIINCQIDQLNKEITSLEEKSKPVSPDVSLGRLTRQEAMQEQELSKHLLEDSKLRLNRLRYTLSKVYTEDYGVCILCEEDIPIGRLKIIPESTVCVECANNPLR